MFDKYSLWSDIAQLCGASVNLGLPELDLEPEFDALFGGNDDSNPFAQLRSSGVNVVFLSMPISFILEPPCQGEAKGCCWLDHLVNRAEEVGLYIVLAFRSNPSHEQNAILKSGEFPRPHCQHKSDHHKCDPAAQPSFVQIWQLVADMFKDRDSIVGYDLFIDPPAQPKLLNDAERLGEERCADIFGANWQELCQRTVAAIREIDADTPILIQPAAWAAPETLPAWQQIGWFRSPI
jgi:aryl-phospho-beta-D-glucosidase BglC (GH1 family)